MYWPKDVASDKRRKFESFLDSMWKKFIQMKANRLIVGVYRYDLGKPTKAAKYLTRLKAELEAYDKTGNREHLVNLSNYAFLESVAPEHPLAHFEHVSKSITRDLLGMSFDAEGFLIDKRTGERRRGD